MTILIEINNGLPIHVRLMWYLLQMYSLNFQKISIRKKNIATIWTTGPRDKTGPCMSVVLPIRSAFNQYLLYFPFA